MTPLESSRTTVMALMRAGNTIAAILDQGLDSSPEDAIQAWEKAVFAAGREPATEGTTTMTTYVGLVQRGEILQQRIVAEGNDRAAVEKTARTRAAELNAGQEPDGFELAWKAATLPRKS